MSKPSRENRVPHEPCMGEVKRTVADPPRSVNVDCETLTGPAGETNRLLDGCRAAGIVDRRRACGGDAERDAPHFAVTLLGTGGPASRVERFGPSTNGYHPDDAADARARTLAFLAARLSDRCCVPWCDAASSWCDAAYLPQRAFGLGSSCRMAMLSGILSNVRRVR